MFGYWEYFGKSLVANVENAARKSSFDFALVKLD